MTKQQLGCDNKCGDIVECLEKWSPKEKCSCSCGGINHGAASHVGVMASDLAKLRHKKNPPSKKFMKKISKKGVQARKKNP